jgi:hypothetical protein
MIIINFFFDFAGAASPVSGAALAGFFAIFFLSSSGIFPLFLILSSKKSTE